jgi:hypothetical protein
MCDPRRLTTLRASTARYRAVSTLFTLRLHIDTYVRPYTEIKYFTTVLNLLISGRKIIFLAIFRLFYFLTRNSSVK